MSNAHKELRLIAICDRLKRHLGNVAVKQISQWQPVADALGKELQIKAADTAIFGEEVISNQSHSLPIPIYIYLACYDDF